MTFSDLDLFLGLSAPQQLLIVEDSVEFAVRLRNFLSTMGHKVHSYSGIISGESNVPFGVDPHSPSDPDRIELDKYDGCFLDHYFLGGEFTGTTLMPLLAMNSIKVCGMSSVDSANESMKRSGAICAVRKDKLAQLLSLYRS